jgi:hypothetical protein
MVLSVTLHTRQRHKTNIVAVTSDAIVSDEDTLSVRTVLQKEKLRVAT